MKPAKYHQLNTCSLRCPEPMMLIKKTLRSMKYNEVLIVKTDDITSAREIIQFCNFMKHKLLKYTPRQRYCLFTIKKGA